MAYHSLVGIVVTFLAWIAYIVIGCFTFIGAGITVLAIIDSAGKVVNVSVQGRWSNIIGTKPAAMRRLKQRAKTNRHTKLTLCKLSPVTTATTKVEITEVDS